MCPDTKKSTQVSQKPALDDVARLTCTLRVDLDLTPFFCCHCFDCLAGCCVGLFTIISFPFLFGIMYGDVGHGCLLGLASLVLCGFETRLSQLRARGEMGEVLSMIFSGRYALLMMSLFAIYAGAIYNDVFSLPTRFFASGWTHETIPHSTSATEVTLKPEGRPYPFGIDPAWHNSRNELAFYSQQRAGSNTHNDRARA